MRAVKTMRGGQSSPSPPDARASGSGYDAAANRFDLLRPLPDGATQGIRLAVIRAVGSVTRPHLLDLGAGAGGSGARSWRPATTISASTSRSACLAPSSGAALIALLARVWQRPPLFPLLAELGERLLSGSLSDVARATEATPDFAILPWLNVVKIGGQSIMDRGRAAVAPLVDEIVANLGRHKMVLGTGAGTRARHVYSVAIDLGLPTGVLTVLGTAVAWQNAQMLQYLLAKHGVAFLEPEGFPSLPHYLMERGAVICQGMPPYKLWETNPKAGRIPPQRTDTGCFLIAEVFGARKMIYVKDEDGLYNADPKKDATAAHIQRISVQELLRLDLDDLIVERAVLELMLNTRNVKEIQFVNGLKPGQLTAALDGEQVGTVIYKAEAMSEVPA